MRLSIAAVCLFALTAHAVDVGHGLRGYTPEDSATEVSWETKFRAIPEPDRIRENMRRLSARPHHVGSPYDHDNAEWLLAQMKSYGLDAQIEQFSALFPTPKSRKLELLGPKPFTAKLQEPALSVDPTSNQQSEQLPTYNAYSRDGDVTAPLVYVNYGRPEDYDELDRMGVSVKGEIVIARYGMSWRGIKPKVAAEHGAIGCIIYSDPRDDGYFRGDTYPEGPMRPPEGAQRGSVMDMPVYPGDPQTPGVGAVPGVKLIPLDQVKTITKIPVLPISYADATPFLQALGGETVPEAWRGGLPFTYHAGPSKAKRPSGAGVQLGPQAAVRRGGEDSGCEVSGPVGDSREPSRCVGERSGGSAVGLESGAGRGASVGRTAEAGVEAGSGRSSTASGTARSRRCWDRRSGRRRMRMS